MLPIAGVDIKLLPDVVPMLNSFKEAGIKVAVASRLQQTDWALQLLSSFQILEKIDFMEIQPEQKTVHFECLQRDSGVPFKQMIFFDDLRDGRYGNCVPVSSTLGVFSVHCPLGVHRRLVHRGLEEYVKWFSSGDCNLGGAILEESGTVTLLSHQVRMMAPLPQLKPSSAILVQAPTPEEWEFVNIAFRIFDDQRKTWNRENSGRFRTTFGTSPTVCNVLWHKLCELGPGPKICHCREHFLWALMWLKEYAAETEMRNQIGGGVGEKTIRKWVRFYVEAISGLAPFVIIWENRKEGDIGCNCLIAVDGTDFRIVDQHDGDYASWKSIKKAINGPAVRWEVATCIQTGKLVWIHGPFKGGTHDKNIFDCGLKHMLEPGERAEADDGYRGLPNHIALPVDAKAVTSASKMSKSLTRRRHETANKRFKQWGCLSQTYRHNVQFHKHVFTAVAVITQVILECGEPLFPVEYNIV